VRKYRIKRRSGQVVSSTADDLITPSVIRDIYAPGSPHVSDDCLEKDPLKIEHWNRETEQWDVILDKIAELGDVSSEIKGLVGEALGDSPRRHYRVQFSNGNSWTMDSGEKDPASFADRYRRMRDGPDLARVVEISVLDDRGGSAPYWKPVWDNADELDELSGEINSLIGEAFGWWGEHDYRVILKDGAGTFGVSSVHGPEKFLEFYLSNHARPLSRIEYFSRDGWKPIWDATDDAENLGSEIKSLLGDAD
jgi:hypothetical protein